MVTSTSEVRTQSINFANASKQAAIVPSAADTIDTKKIAGSNLKQLSYQQDGYTVSKTLLAKGQQQVTSVQIAQQALGVVGRDLQAIKKILSTELIAQRAVSPSAQSNANHHLDSIKHTLNNAKSDGLRVIDAELKVNIDRPITRTFSVPGLNVQRQREHSELIKLSFQQLGTVVVNMDAKLSDKALVSQIDRHVIPFGLRASQQDNGDIVFRTNEQSFQGLEGKVQVIGQGHRYPAGQANTLTIKPEPEGIEDSQFTFNNREQIRDTLVKVNQHLRQVQQSLDDIKAYQAVLAKQMADAKANTSLGDVKQVEEKLSQLSGAGNQQFSATYRSLAAQANVHRHTVVALLK
ncbi:MULTISPECIES: flagellin [unclassified Photobacterium]|uniref:flagellin n=1 Tax=unclassified Photobacterium TaxID=2628852 RepID=UPI000D164789|nr:MULTISPECIES: flagellin [unclassified Photobacterium]PSV26214.1 flagellin [Photobacterium sp. GB-56]PSV34314.1 flagellin [Photobacterium sp. GB-210]PSV45056.1 flagellin [Photobacterium sp. GB-36]PSV55993.1 flagellin [Photobacterium sp. GB-3]PSW74160.1 flagellin [Photobacterium sp. GB-50]